VQVVIIGRDADKLEAKLPKGFILDRENETCSVLCRKSSPPPLLCQGSDDDDDDDDNEGWTGEADPWGPRAADEGEEGGNGEGNVYDEMPDAASLTDREFRDAVRRRMQVKRTSTLTRTSRDQSTARCLAWQMIHDRTLNPQLFPRHAVSFGK
jgi:hypothetical protein